MTTGRVTRTALTLLACAMLSTGAGAQDRLPPLPAEKMTEAQKKAAADFAAVRNTPPTGPFSVMLRIPELMDLTFKWRQHVQMRSTFDQRLTELVILVTARHWTQQYEWNAHQPAALKAGLKQEIIAAIAEGRRPDRMADDEAALYDLVTEVLHNQAVSDPTYDRALAKFGEAGIVEATSVAGYYAMLAMVMNTARTPLAPGTNPPLAPFPH
ncbi:MAG: carboxymuconolactone decarboxylase family protein [Acidimicrobiia bacterium]|nr:carboxymuconolactone decarboxylase family protein [Acidimicrobiia bacterium]